MNEKDKRTIEIIRAAVRPILIIFLGITSFLLIVNEMEGTWVDWWIGLFIFGGGEWIFERPVVKLLNSVNIARRQQ